MARHLDLASLRSFVAVAESGGVTRAAGFLHLTQSAVSMQIKRLEEALQVRLFDRTGRGVTTTAEGEQLLGYARRLLALNDEALGRMTGEEFEGEITIGVPHDIVQPAIPQVLRRFAAGFPRMRLRLVTSNTATLRDRHAKGSCDVIVTTEREIAPGGEVLKRSTLHWVGAPGGRAGRMRPLPLAFEEDCIFRPDVTARLDAAGIPWRMSVETESLRTVSAMVCADLAVHAMLDGAATDGMVPVDEVFGLPPLEDWCIGLYLPPDPDGPTRALAGYVREAYAAATATAAATAALSVAAE